MNESIAPNEYIVPRKSVWPGRIVRIGITPAKTTSASHGVLNRGMQAPEDRGAAAGTPAIAYVIREAPITPAFVAMNRIVAARTPT